MRGDERDRSGMRFDLKNECLKVTRGSTRCSRNIGEAIGEFHSAIGGYDLIGLQEASQFQSLKLKNHGVNLASRSIRGYAGMEPVVSLYNRKKLGDPSVQISGRLSYDVARPFIILIFDKVKIIFINFHNTHAR